MHQWCISQRKNERKETSALRWQRVELYKQRSSPSASPQKSEKKIWLTWSLFLPNYLFIVVSKLIPKSQQKMGRMELNIKSSRRNVRIRFRRFVRFNFFPFPFEQLYRLVTPMETGHSIEFRDMKTISFWLLNNSTSTCDMLFLVLEIPCYFQGPIFCIFFWDTRIFLRSQGKKATVSAVNLYPECPSQFWLVHKDFCNKRLFPQEHRAYRYW